MGRSIIANISQSAIQHNLQRIREMAPGKKIIAMVKANGYGHGMVSVAKAIPEVDAFGVASIEEAILLRKSGVQTDIILMEGVFSQEDIQAVQQYDFIQVVHAPYQVEILKKQVYPFKIWLKINTGMNRLGFAPKQFVIAYDEIIALGYIELIGFMTHFAKADHKQDDMTKRQRDLFFKTVGSRTGAYSLCNSAGIVHWPECQGDWVRPGLLLVGASPFSDCTGSDLGLKPAMNLVSTLIAIQWVTAGEQVGYAGTWVNSLEDRLVGVVAIGYGDGYPWHAQNGTPVLIHNQQVPLIGRVSMDMITVDLTSLLQHQIQPKIGDIVTLWGDNLPIEHVATHAGTVPWELFCRLTERVTMQMV